MCLLVASASGEPVSRDICENATENNGDGFGVAYPSEDKTRVVVHKWAFLKPKEQAYIIRKLAQKGVPYIAHWRFGTAGGTYRKLAHPFKVSRTCALAHNGVLPIQPRHGESDTSTLVKLFQENEIIDARKIIEYTIKYNEKHSIGYNKIATINERGDIFIFNKRLGDVVDDVWFSNATGHYCHKPPVVNDDDVHSIYDTLRDISI